MQQLVRQLEAVRETGRRLLLVQRLLRWLAILIAIALTLSITDYLLRLPGWLRLALGVTFGLLLIWRLATWIASAAAFRPELGTLAMRAELLFPQLSGALASGVEFVMEPEKYRSPEVTEKMAELSVKDLESRLTGVDLRKLIEPRPTVRQAGLAVAALVVLSATIFASPEAAVLATKRWLLPLGDTQWPLRTHLTSLVTHAVWPMDTPLRLQARVSKGYASGMRAWVQYRLVFADGSKDAWRALLMNDQSAASAAAGATMSENERGTFERLVELGQEYESTRRGKAAANAGAPVKIEFTFEAGDASTEAQEVALTQRPALREFKLGIAPPAYAAGVLPNRIVSMDRQTGTFVSEAALAGSRLEWTLVLNKSIPEAQAQPASIMPGWDKAWVSKSVKADLDRLGSAGEPTIVLKADLSATIESQIKLTDEHGLSSLSDRVYRVEAAVDQLPAATITQPAMDEGVLATAVVPIEGMGTDDVALESLALEAVVVKAGTQPTTMPSGGTTLNTTTGRNPKLLTAATATLSGMSLAAGDEVLLTAIAQDIYELDGKRHPAVRSQPRRLRVIDQASLTSQLRNDLDAIRQQAIRLQAQQDQLAQLPLPQSAAAAQPDLTRAIENQSSMLKAVQDRMTRNRMEDPAMSQLVQQAREMANKATQSARDAQPALDKASKLQKDDADKSKEEHNKAREDQKSASESLRDLASLLDSGKDTAGIQMALSAMIAEQKKLSEESKAMQPKTMGLSPSQLKPEDKAKLDDMNQRQQSLNKRAEELLRKMQLMADQQARQANTPAQQAAAKALADAAKTAQEQALSQQMQSAASQTQQNKLGDAGKSQQNAAATMEKMAEQLANQDKVQQEQLKRKMMQLADAVKKLIEQQKEQIVALDAANNADLPGLDEGMSQLRRNTLVVAEDAKKVKQAAQPAQLITKATEYQADAITALREATRGAANTGEKQSLAALESALKLLNKAAESDDEKSKSDEKKKLREAYEQLAARETELRKATAALSALENPTRRERADMIDLGNKQADIQIQAAALAEKVQSTFLFAHMHTRIERTAGSVAMRLRSATADRAVLADEDNLIAMFKSLAQALKDAEKNDPFLDEKQDSSGGEGPGGGSPPLVPPVAELKLLRELQTVIHDQTRVLSQSKPTPETEARIRREVQELAGQQNELSRLGVQLIERLQKNRPGGTPPAGPPEDPHQH